MPFVLTDTIELDEHGVSYRVVDLDATTIEENDIKKFENVAPRNVKVAKKGDSINTPLDSGYPQIALGGELIFTMIIKGADGKDATDTYPAIDFSQEPARPWTIDDVDKNYDHVTGNIHSDEGATFTPKRGSEKEFIIITKNIAVMRNTTDGTVSRQLIRAGGAFRIARDVEGNPSIDGGVNPEAMVYAWAPVAIASTVTLKQPIAPLPKPSTT